MSSVLAQLDPEGLPVPVPRGQPVTLFRKLIEDDHDLVHAILERYPLGPPADAALPAIGDPMAFEVSVAYQTLDAWGPADLARHCLHLVEVEDPPGLQQVAELGLQLVDGVITAEPTFEKAPVPPTVSRMQALLTLDAQGLLDQVDAAVAAAPRSVQIYWAHAGEFHRDHAILGEMIAGLGWSADQVDDLFRCAAQVV